MRLPFSLPPKFGRWLIIAAVLIYVGFIVGGRSGLVALYSSHRQTVAMKAEIIRLNAQVDSLDTVIDRLRHDTVFIERMAREKLGMARSDEVVFKFIDKAR